MYPSGYFPLPFPVRIINPTSGQIPIYDSTSGYWQNGNGSTSNLGTQNYILTAPSSSLPNSRGLAVDSSLTLVDGGAQNYVTISMPNTVTGGSYGEFDIDSKGRITSIMQERMSLGLTENFVVPSVNTWHRLEDWSVASQFHNNVSVGAISSNGYIVGRNGSYCISCSLQFEVDTTMDMVYSRILCIRGISHWVMANSYVEAKVVTPLHTLNMTAVGKFEFGDKIEIDVLTNTTGTLTFRKYLSVVDAFALDDPPFRTGCVWSIHSL